MKKHKGIHRRHHKHHKGRSSQRNRKRELVIAGVSFLFVFILIGISAFVIEDKWSLAGILNDDADDEDEETEHTITLYDKTYVIRDKFDTLLFMGTDYSGNEEGEGEDYQGSLSDFLMLMVINHTENTYAFLPIDRNTITEIHLIDENGEGEATADEQICTAHWYGGSKEMGCENTVTAVSEYLGGLTIDGYYALSMSELPKINHALGGITVTLTDDFSSMDPEMKPGATLTLTDEQAEIYLHSRMNLADDTNKNRMERHRIYLEEALKKAKAQLKENPDYIDEMSEAFSEKACSTITGKQKSRAANALAEYENKGIFDIEGETILGEELGDGELHEEFYPDEDSVVQVMTDLYHLEEEDDE